MTQQLLNGWQWHWLAIQSIRSRIEKCCGKGMTQIVWTQRRGQFGSLTKLGNNLTNAAFCEWSPLAKKEMPIRPYAPRCNGFSTNSFPLLPMFCKMLSMFEIGVEWFAYFLDEWDFTVFESFATSNDEQITPCRNLNIWNLE